MLIDTSVFAAIAAVVNIIATVGGGFFFVGKMTSRVDGIEASLVDLKKDVSDTKILVTASAVHESRIDRMENDIQAAETAIDMLRRGIGFIQDRKARSVDREY